MSFALTQTCFLLNHTGRDVRGKFEITLYAKSADQTPVIISIDSFRPLFFVPRTTPADATSGAMERKRLPLKSMADGMPVDCLYFMTNTAFQENGRKLRENGQQVLESDIHPVERYLMERSVRGGFEAKGVWQQQNKTLCCRNPQLRGASFTPALSVLSFDIETNARTQEILSIASCGKRQTVFVRGSHVDSAPVFFCPTERELLTRFFDHVKSEDPDVIIGWNVVDFDLWTIQERCDRLQVQFRLGRGGDRDGGRITEGKRDGTKKAYIPGRVVIDTPFLLRTYYRPFEEYSLDFVASMMLGKGKLIHETGAAKIDEIIRLWNVDPLALARYNLEDAALTLEIFERSGILPNAIERSKRSGQLLDRSGGSVAAFDYLYLPLLHRAGFVAPDSVDVPLPLSPLPGGFVLEPKPGLYENVLVLDFKSLYPSIIMTFKIDPLGLVNPAQPRITGPAGPSFSDDNAILPSIIAELMQARAAAKRDNNPYLSQAIKILMNSFYGVLGAQGCRFFSAELATTITRTGQYILKQTIEYIQSSTPYPVIYGDTDSLFVHLGQGRENMSDDIGKTIGKEVTAWFAAKLKERFGVVSALELQFERSFRHFFMPPLRGSTQGSKKHYCGSFTDSTGAVKLIFKGMESARSDWTDLAKEFQHELFIALFAGKPVVDFIVATVERVRSGRADDKLVYKKRLRKKLDEYTINIPPHVQAAKLLDHPGHLIRYYITTAGPQPLEKRSAPLDYEHYVESQLKPIADSILEMQGTNFDRIVSGQQDLFAK